MKGLAFTLSNNLGAYEVGVYSALRKYKRGYKAIVGTGIGAFNAAMMASFEYQKLKKIWLDPALSPILESLNHSIVGKDIDTKKLSLESLIASHEEKGLEIGSLAALIRNNVEEKRVRLSNRKYGVISLRFSDLKEMPLYIENITKGELNDNIVASLFLDDFRANNLIEHNNKTKLDAVEMLKKRGCTSVIVIGNETKEYEDIDVSYIHPKVSKKVATIENKTSQENMRRGYLDTLKYLNKLDGDVYYFKKKTYNYFKSINKNVDKELYEVVSSLLKSQDVKTTTIKAIEYAFENENRSFLNIYKIDNALVYLKSIKSSGFIYDYLRSLNI